MAYIPAKEISFQSGSGNLDCSFSSFYGQVYVLMIVFCTDMSVTVRIYYDYPTARLISVAIRGWNVSTRGKQLC